MSKKRRALSVRFKVDAVMDLLTGWPLSSSPSLAGG